jgi:hypothetical protein
MGGAGGGGSGGGAGLAGGAGVLSSAGGGRDDDDGDIVDGGNGMGIEGETGSRGGRRWLPSKSIISSASKKDRIQCLTLTLCHPPCGDFDIVDSEINLNSSPSSNRTPSTLSFSSAKTPKPGC